MKKTIIGFVGACSAVMLVGCGSDSGTPAQENTSTSAAAVRDSAAPTSTSGAPAAPAENPSSQAPASSSASDGGSAAQAPAGAPAGAALPRTYQQACSDVLTYLDGYQEAIDDAGEEMGMTRESLAGDMLTSIQAYPEWSTLSEQEQSEVTRGFDAAAAGSC